MSDRTDVSRQLEVVLGQGLGLLEKLEPELYGRSPEPLTRSPVGAHFRHVLDCCEVFLDGTAAGRVDYDRRARDGRTEVEPVFAAHRLQALVRRLAGLSRRDMRETLEVRSDVAADIGPEEGWRRSTIERELLYVFSHTVHHYALIAMILRHFDVEPGEDFGVAPSTLRYWEESGRCAPLPG